MNPTETVKFVEASQKLGKALVDLALKHSVSARMSIGKYTFYAKGTEGADQVYVYEVGVQKDGDVRVFAVRKRWNGWEDVPSNATTLEDIKVCLRYIPVMAKLLEIEDAIMLSEAEDD